MYLATEIRVNVQTGDHFRRVLGSVFGLDAALCPTTAPGICFLRPAGPESWSWDVCTAALCWVMSQASPGLLTHLTKAMTE